MKGLQTIASFATGISVLALMAQAAPMVATAASTSGPDIDLAIARAAAAPVTPATVNSGQNSGGTATAGEKCLVKFFEPSLLASFEPGGAPEMAEPLAFVQAKLICNATVGTAELLIEQNDQIVVAQTVTNDQTDVSLFSQSLSLNGEQMENFCFAIARENADDGTFTVVSQECYNDLGHTETMPWAGKPGVGAKAPLPGAAALKGK